MLLWRVSKLAFLVAWLIPPGIVWAAAEQPLTVEQLVEVAIEVNPQVRASEGTMGRCSASDLAELCSRGSDLHLRSMWTAAQEFQRGAA